MPRQLHMCSHGERHRLARADSAPATGPHDHLGDRKVRLVAAVVGGPSVDEQRHTTTAARCGANGDPVDQLELRARIGPAHDHPVRVRADAALVRCLPPSVEGHPCTALPVAVHPVCVSGQNPLLGAPGVPRDRAHRELALNDGPEGDHRRCGARQCQHLA
eukprot:scaffold34653_cov76-Phaeocystis_antarctica.AAC.3